MNQNKLFTLNSQPQVNGAKSSDDKYGWGPENGYVYQKAYFELFVDQSIIEILCKFLEKYPTISYQAVNKSGLKFQNVEDGDVNAVTWGVFKGKEIVQPTVVDAEAFMIWKDEALKIFTNTWAVIYQSQKNEKGEEIAGDDASCEFMKKCTDSLYLVNIVENDYIGGDLNAVIKQFIEENKDALTAL